MKRVLPPFSAVRAFEAAARHLSFKRAAEELSVSQSAISHQIRALEEFLGRPLFRREANGVALTETGIRYCRDISPALDRINDATRRCTGRPLGPRKLHVRATPAFATRWLLRNVQSFGELHPDIEMKVTTGIELPDFRTSDVDIVIQYGQATAEGLNVEPFMSTGRIPVCSPRLVAKTALPLKPADILQYPLLRDEVGDGWRDWFRSAGVDCPDRLGGPVFEHCDLSLRAAELGHGIALAYETLVTDEIAAGALLKVCEIRTPPREIYSIACPTDRMSRRKESAFRAWLLQNAPHQEMLTPGLVEPA